MHMSAKYYTQFRLTDANYRGGNEFSGVVELSRPMDEESDVTDIVTELYADVRIELHRPAANSVLAHLTKLVDDGAVGVVGGGRQRLDSSFAAL